MILKNIVKIIIINLAVFLFLSEVILRYVYTPKAVKYRIEINNLTKKNNKENKIKFDFSKLNFTPNSNRKMLHAEYEIATVHDEFGYRNPCFKKIKNKESVKQLILGDSFVYGVGVKDENTLSCKLFKKNIYTIGLPGAGPKIYLDVLKKQLRTLNKNFPNLQKINIVFFLGNDFEDLLNIYENKEVVTNKINSNKISFLQKINRYITENEYLKQSYLLASIKLILKPIIFTSDKGKYILSYANSSFYKKNVSLPVNRMSLALNYFKKEIEKMNFNINKIFLIEDPAAIFNERLERDMSLASYNFKNININFKNNSIKQACKKINIECIIVKSIFQKNDFYIQDNHLNNAGSIKLANYISKII